MHQCNRYGVFTVPDTDNDKMGLQPNYICVCVCVGQYEHFHTILYNPFFIGVVVCVGVWQCEHSINRQLWTKTHSQIRLLLLFTLTEAETETDKNELCGIVWRCSY